MSEIQEVNDLTNVPLTKKGLKTRQKLLDTAEEIF